MRYVEMKWRALEKHPGFRFAALVGLWAASLLVYFGVLVRPYPLSTYLFAPKTSLGVVADRQLGPAAGFVLGFLILFALYALGYQLCKNWASISTGCVVVLGGMISAILLSQAYPVGASDVFGYVGAGELLVDFGLNPMVYPVNRVPELPFREFMSYVSIPYNYGPVWVWIEALVVRVLGTFDLMALVMGFKIVNILAYLATCLLVALLLRRRAPKQMVAGLLAFAWNPLGLFEVATNAHNDMFVGMFVLFGVLFWEMRRSLLALVMLTCAALIKLPIAPLLAFFGVAAWVVEPSTGRQKLLVRGGLAILITAAAAYLSLPQGLTGVMNLQYRSEWFTHSLPAVIRLVLQTTLPEPTATALVGAMTLGVLSIYMVVQWRNVYRAPSETIRWGFNVLLFLLLFCTTWFQPWYLLWILPLSAVYPRPNAPFQVALSTLCVIWSYVVYGFVWFWYPEFGNWGNFLGINLVALATTYALPWIYAVLYFRQNRLLARQSN